MWSHSGSVFCGPRGPHWLIRVPPAPRSGGPVGHLYGARQPVRRRHGDRLSQSKDGPDLAKQFNDMDPAKQVRTLLDSGSIAAVGQEVVGGVPTVHYAGTVPVAKYLDQVDSASRAQVEKELSDKGIGDVKLDLWVDGKYLPRRGH